MPWGAGKKEGVPVKSIDPREAQVDRRDDIKDARRMRVKKMLAKSRKGR